MWRREGQFSLVRGKSYFSIPRDIYNAFRYDPRRVLRATRTSPQISDARFRKRLGRVWNAWRGRRWEAVSAQLDSRPCFPHGIPRRRRPRCRSAAPGGHKVAGFAVLRAPGRVPRARAATDLVLASWPAAWMTLMARAREARASRSGPWLRCGSARQTVQHHATTRCRGQPQPCRSEGIHVVAARPGVFVHFSHVMNTIAPAATPGRRPFSAGAPGIAHGARHPAERAHTALGNAERAHTAPVAERGVERPGCARPCPRVPARDPVRRACVERPGPAPCAHVATA